MWVSDVHVVRVRTPPDTVAENDGAEEGVDEVNIGTVSASTRVVITERSGGHGRGKWVLGPDDALQFDCV